MNSPILAIIVPCHNEDEVLKEAYFQLSSVLQSLMQEQKISPKSYVCFVDDGSTDKSWEIISKISKYNDAKGLKLSRDFGHQSAQLAGLTQNEADIYVTTDADLQDDIELIGEMVEKYKQGCEVVYGVRQDRTVDGFLKKHTAQIYYKLAIKIGIRAIYNHADFRLMSKRIVDILANLKECNMYLRGLIPSLGFKSCCVYYTRKKRIAGISKFNFISCLALAVEGLTSFSSSFLHLIMLFGLLSFLGFIIISIYLILAILTSKSLPHGWFLFISIYFVGCVQLLSLGIIGEYIGKIYKETKQRPKFIVEQKVE